MEEPVPMTPRAARKPLQRGADDQAQALRELLARMEPADAAEDEQHWQTVKRLLQETRRALGQRLLFPE